MPPSLLLYEGSTIYAQPAFRILVQLDLPLADPQARQAMSSIFEAFIAVAAPRLALFAWSGGKVKALKPESFDDNAIAKARKLIAEAEWSWPSTLRLNAMIDEPHSSVAPPHLRFEQRARLATIQIELPPDHPDPVAFSDLVQSSLAGLPVIWGVMGFGLYQPVAISSLIWMLPRITPRFPAAIEVQPDYTELELRRTATLEELRHKQEPARSLPDIGWRTLIGEEFHAALPGLEDLAQYQGISVAQETTFTIVSAGPLPIWGDVNQAEDSAAYRTIAAALAPCKTAWVRVRDALFGTEESPDGLDRREAWYERFEV